jgi:hypothetical protein
MIRTLVLLAAFGLAGAVLAAQSLKQQTSNLSAVAVKVTPRNVQGDVWEFDVVFDTHSQDLNDDLLKNAVLAGASGAQATPVAWNGDPPGGHHRKGVLRFNAIKPRPDTLELRIHRPGEAAPRGFRWSMK